MARTKADFVKSFIDALGDSKNWDYTGNCYDLGAPTGSCICGHPIRYAYEIQKNNSNEVKFVGSECINFFKDYNPSLYKKLVEAEEKRLEDIKEGERLLKRKEIEEIQKVVEKKVIEFRNAYKAAYPSWCAKYDLWKFFNGLRTSPSKPYKNLGSLKKWFEKTSSDIDYFMSMI